MPGNVATASKAKVLLVQSAQTQGNSTRRFLEHSRYDVIWAGSGISALMSARNQRVDLILLDFALPDIEGGDLCRLFRTRDDTRDIPIILLTGRGSAPESFSRPPQGPDDYLAKPYTESELDGRIMTVLKARAATKTARVEQQGAVRTEAKQEAAQVRQSSPAQHALPLQAVPPAQQKPLPTPAEHPAGQPTGQPPAPAADDNEVVDTATGLFSRRQFEAMFSKEFKRSVRFKQQMSCMMIDLDGRAVGRTADAALVREIIGLVQTTIREVDTAAVWTGDAFIVLLPNTIRNDAVQAGMRVLEAVAVHPFSWPDSTRITMSIGVAGMPDKNIDTEQKMLEAAQKACGRARDWARE